MGGIPLPGLAQTSKDCVTVAQGQGAHIPTSKREEKEHSPEEPSPNGSEPQSAQRLFTEVRLSAAQLQRTIRARKHAWLHVPDVAVGNHTQ